MRSGADVYKRQGYDDAGQLTESVHRRPYQVILFDEIEKAHPDVFNTLLQLLDDGRLTDGQGRTIDFRNTVVIMTSNVGTEHVRQVSIGLVRNHDRNAEAAARDRVQEALREAFRPEFLNRIDEVIVFQALTEQELHQIVTLLLNDVASRLQEQQIMIELSTEAMALLVREGYNPAYGARPLRRTIQRLVETPLSRELLRSNYQEGDTVSVDVDESGNSLVFSKKPADLLDLMLKKPTEPLGA